MTTNTAGYAQGRIAVQRCLREVDGPRDAALDAVRALAKEQAEVAEYLLELGVQEACRAYVQGTRTTIWRGSRTDSANGTIAGISANMTAYDFRLPGGKRLGDATKDDLGEAIAFWREQARGNMRNAKWLERVQKAMGKATTVSEGVQLEALVKMQRAADKEVGINAE